MQQNKENDISQKPLGAAEYYIYILKKVLFLDFNFPLLVVFFFFFFTNETTQKQENISV